MRLMWFTFSLETNGCQAGTFSDSMALRIDRLQALREQKGWSQRELARRCGLGESMIRKYESTQTDPTTSSLKQIAEVLGASSDYLIGITNDPRGHMGDGVLNPDENLVLNTFRQDGWTGIARLGVERIAK